MLELLASHWSAVGCYGDWATQFCLSVFSVHISLLRTLPAEATICFLACIPKDQRILLTFGQHDRKVDMWLFYPRKIDMLMSILIKCCKFWDIESTTHKLEDIFFFLLTNIYWWEKYFSSAYFHLFVMSENFGMTSAVLYQMPNSVTMWSVCNSSVIPRIIWNFLLDLTLIQSHRKSLWSTST